MKTTRFRKFVVPTTFGAVLLALLLNPLRAAEPALYTACNIWHEKSDEMESLNCKAGQFIPAGTAVEMRKIGRDEAVFKTKPDGKEYTLKTVSRYFQNLSSKDVADFYFTPTTFEEQTAGLTPREVELIRRGQIEGGMSKKAILISYGRPAPHKTPALEGNTWYYWGKDSRDQMELKFDPSGKLIADASLNERLDTLWNYTACNIWFDEPDEISSVNYHLGTMIPAGARVSQVKIDRDKIAFSVEGFRQSFVMNDFRHQEGLALKVVASRFFTAKPFDELTAGLSAQEIAAIRKGQTIPGMSKRAVLIAFGYPPPHRTASLDLNSWQYWAKNQFAVNFDGNGCVTEKEPAPVAVAGTKPPPARIIEAPAPKPEVKPQVAATPPPYRARTAPDTSAQPAPAAVTPPAETAPAWSVADGKGWAVIIGIADYKFAGKGALSNLAFADDDAKAFGEALRNQGWPSSHVKLLINEDATLRNITVALESWLTKAAAKDMIVLFWSGHGFPDPEDQEKVYFACYDTDISIPATGYRMDRVHETLAERRAKNVVVFADTCHAGKLMTRGTKGVSVAGPVERMRRDQTTPKGWIFMVSAEADRLAIEHSSWSNGAFSHCLMDGLSGKADGFQSSGERDGQVTMQELRTYMETMMPEETERVLGVARHPIITTSSGDPTIWALSLRQK